MIVCLTFDDGRSDQYSIAYPLLKKYKLYGTFFVTTGFIDGTFKSESFGKNRKPISKDQMLEMYENGMEIASHGDKHIMDFSDFNISIEKLNKWGIRYDKYGFSIPNSEYSQKDLSLFRKQLEDKLLYVRVGRNPKCYTFENKIYYLLYNSFNWSCCYEKFNRNNLINSDGGDSLFSLVIKKRTSALSLIKFIEKHKSEDSVLIIMLHSLSSKPNNKWEWNKNNFNILCKYLSENSNFIEIKTMRQLFI